LIYFFIALLYQNQARPAQSRAVEDAQSESERIQAKSIEKERALVLIR
jgi:hypothetical protein